MENFIYEFLAVIFCSFLFSYPLSVVFWLIGYPFYFIHKKRMDGMNIFIRPYKDVIEDIKELLAFISGLLIFISYWILMFSFS